MDIIPEILDSFGHKINGSVSAGQQIQIAGYLTNDRNTNETFAYLVQIEDSNGVTLSLSWLTGNLNPYKSFKPVQSWTPIASGNYVVQIFVWSSLTNPIALLPEE